MPVKSNCGEGVTQREKQRQPRQGCSSVTAREVCVFTGGTTRQSAVSALRVGVRYSYLQKNIKQYFRELEHSSRKSTRNGSFGFG